MYIISAGLHYKYSWFSWLKQSILCIRYNDMYHCCLINNSPKLVKSKKLRVEGITEKEVSRKEYMAGKDFLEDILAEERLYTDPRLMLTEYITTMKVNG